MTDAEILAGFNAALDRWFAAHDACLASIIARRETEIEGLRNFKGDRQDV